ncbi:MAG TPA: hypothetical protein VFH51_19130, partial [Myxococcota bacterium]|nr:hypothetical protein [Myxococcota bacterium]
GGATPLGAAKQDAEAVEVRALLRQSTAAERRSKRHILATRIVRGVQQGAGRWASPGVRSALKKDVHSLRVCLRADGWASELLPLRRSQFANDGVWYAHLRDWTAAIELTP